MSRRGESRRRVSERPGGALVAGAVCAILLPGAAVATASAQTAADASPRQIFDRYCVTCQRCQRRRKHGPAAAAGAGYDSVVQYLVAQGARTDLENAEGRTPLALAQRGALRGRGRFAARKHRGAAAPPRRR